MPTSESVSRDQVGQTLEESDAETWVDASEIGPDAARSAWAVAARDELLDIAGSYQAVITYKELAEAIQVRTRIRTNQRMQHWVGDVLARVSVDCVARSEPLLSALCVNASGSVGEGYAVAVATARGDSMSDADGHAALERLECYRVFGATLPAGGGSAALTPKLSASRTRERKAAAAERSPELCPSCFTALPSAGSCGFCS